MKNTCQHLYSFPQNQRFGGIFADRYSLVGATSQIWRDVVSV